MGGIMDYCVIFILSAGVGYTIALSIIAWQVRIRWPKNG